MKRYTIPFSEVTMQHLAQGGSGILSQGSNCPDERFQDKRIWKTSRRKTI